MNTKEQLRKKIATRRRALSSETIAKNSKTIITTLISLPEFREAKTIGLYLALPGEVDLGAIFSTCWETGKQTVVPIFNETSQRYYMGQLKSDTVLESANLGVKEPVNSEPISLSEIDFIIIPGVAFDLRGSRIGRGGGYYDRLLEGFEGSIAAVSFDFQVFDTIPAEDHDVPVDFIITESNNVKV